MHLKGPYFYTIQNRCLKLYCVTPRKGCPKRHHRRHFAIDWIETYLAKKSSSTKKNKSCIIHYNINWRFWVERLCNNSLRSQYVSSWAHIQRPRANMGCDIKECQVMVHIYIVKQSVLYFWTIYVQNIYLINKFIFPNL